MGLGDPDDGRVCVDCSALAPAPDENTTLISMKYGWRLKRKSTAAGYVMEWRCQECWAKHRKRVSLGPVGEEPSETGVRPRPKS
jgi:hypothetical protein